MYRVRALGTVGLLGLDPTRQVMGPAATGRAQFVEVSTNWVQRALNARVISGADGRPIAVDGRFGPNTSFALETAAARSGKRGLGLSMPVDGDPTRVMIDIRLEQWLAESSVVLPDTGNRSSGTTSTGSDVALSDALPLADPPADDSLLDSPPRTSGVDTTTVVLAVLAATALGVGLYMVRHKRSARKKG